MAKNSLNERIKQKFLDNLIPVDTVEIKQDVENNQVYEIPMDLLFPFRNHTFDVLEDKEMEELVCSIKETGKLLHPALVREIGDGRFEIVSGHRRKRACELAGLKTLSAIVRKMSDDEAALYMAIANFSTRHHIKHSEKARTYSLLFDTFRHPGVKEEDLSMERIASMVGDNAKKVQRYVRLSNMNPELLRYVDDGSLGFIAAVELAGLGEEEQKWIAEFIEDNYRISKDQAKMINEANRNGTLTKFTMNQILLTKPMTESMPILMRNDISKYFPENYTDDQMTEVIMSLVKEWSERR